MDISVIAARMQRTPKEVPLGAAALSAGPQFLRATASRAIL
jgi:hypothetical protein